MILPLLNRWLAPALACLLLLIGPAAASPLVDPAWLRQALASAAPPLLLDASPTRQHGAGHIPGAVNVDFYSYGAREVDAATMQARMRAWGIRNAGEQRIVIHDQGGTMLATWLFYELHRHGVAPERLHLLDGGLAAWKAAGGAVVTELTPAPPSGDVGVGALREDVRVRLPEFLAGAGDPAGHALLEALDPPYYYGGAKFFSRGGHVPHALLTPADDFFRPDKTFKPRAELQALMTHLGVRREQQVYSYCGGGVAASVPYFALKFLLDYPRVALYQGSQKEWLEDPRGLPLWSYAAPALLRDADWLHGFSNTMLRTFSHSPISIIDVRAAEAYALGHLPFALSLPAERFEQELARPERLAALLGPAGVDPTHEAVIVSEGGLNKRSAIVFALLEQLGQRKVSLLLDSVDDWGLRGLSLSKEPTRVGARKPALDPTIAPVDYQAAPRTVLVRGPGAAGPGLPRVYLAVGAQPPSPALPGKTVHLPYGQLLDASGRPKPAHEIWSLLAKAGLPRHAQIISVGDDAGEAAIGYVLLRLMGFADVKLLAA
ncbi:rhodanese-like domain-containing protein [Paucibacter sp. PLA-PC-4]|uniref:rhodanese-like domain-containing protein n=1 Tax=Paucibacter sp. PLA-PC-4 TaxID=2993655 RepID=UPI00224B2698|nr:rhodanese-like domain-containing protein [Paucibacter sp. PLA-PC-4]MCX2863626.1 rhodanese-like domain-containing protein [Paucibacter sp. PLA-PC-4]